MHEQPKSKPKPDSDTSSIPVTYLTGCAGTALIVIATIGIITGILFYAGNRFITDTFNTIGFFFNGEQSADVSIGDFTQSLQAQGQLVTFNIESSTIDIDVSVETGGLGVCNYSASYAADGEIEAGIDLNKLNDDAIRYDIFTGQYIVTLPPAEITSCRIDYIDQYDRSINPCFNNFDTLRQLAQSQAINEFLEGALEQEILANAEQSANIVLEPIFDAITNRNVNIEFASITETTLDASCSGRIPAGWSFDTETGAWKND